MNIVCMFEINYYITYIYYVPTTNTADFTLYYTCTNKFAPADFTTNKICSRITSSVCKSVYIHTHIAVTLICYE